jgi:alkylation response protein AidB-like acyl-CoA dehydrogenase
VDLIASALMPITPAGRRVVRLAEEHAAEFEPLAADYDRRNRYVAENMRAMRKSGFLAACAPEDYGGFGLLSIFDRLVAISRLARGCASTAICANMHMSGVWHLSWAWERARAAGDRQMMDATGRLLRYLVTSESIISGTNTEPGGLWAIPRTEARPTTGGYVITGRKLFATNCELADTIAISVRIPGDDCRYRQGEAFIRTGSPGMTILDDWDALGMRGSGSHTIVLDDCFVPAGRVRAGSPIGPPAADTLLHSTGVDLPLVGTYLGVAEQAFEEARRHAVTGTRTGLGALAERPSVQHEMAEIEVALSAARGALERSGRAVDAIAINGRGRDDAPGFDEPTLWALMKDWQCAKLVVNRAARDIVDRAMTVCGGGSYLNRHTLSRLYRDVRAGSFMQPFGPVDAYPFIGKVSLGRDPFEDYRAAYAELGTTENSDDERPPGATAGELSDTVIRRRAKATAR